MLVLVVIAALVGALAGRTMTAYSLIPTSCLACVAAALISDMTFAGVFWRALALLAAAQAGFVGGAASCAAAASLDRSLTRRARINPICGRIRQRRFRGRLGGSANGEL